MDPDIYRLFGMRSQNIEERSNINPSDPNGTYLRKKTVMLVDTSIQ